jgi:hypothetical protein
MRLPRATARRWKTKQYQNSKMRRAIKPVLRCDVRSIWMRLYVEVGLLVAKKPEL